MNEDVRRLARWMRRARPPRGALARALASGLLASLAGVGMLVAAVALLVDSATRPGLRAVAGVLIIIELIAFLRSPIRFNERLSAHRLGFGAVTRWRHWLVATVGRWNVATWRTYAAGDLLDRSLHDTDELQDLWLRAVIPAFSSIATLAVADLIISVLPPHGGWWSEALILVILQILGIIGLWASFAPQLEADRTVRTVRGAYVAHLIELGAVTPELALLGRDDVARRRSLEAAGSLDRAERELERRRGHAGGVAAVVTIAALALLIVHHPTTSPVWMVVVALLTAATFEALTTVRATLDTAVAVSGAAERLERLERPGPTGRAPWPTDATLRVHDLRYLEERTVLDGVTLSIAPGERVAITGTSGVGKSTLLRLLAGLDQPTGGEVRVGDVALGDLDEADLRRHLVHVPSDPGLFRGFPRDVVRLGRASDRDLAADLAALGLDYDPATRWEDLSRGEGERVAVVRALVSDPAICLLDEPTSGLGRDETAAVLDLLASTGATVVVATHDDTVIAWCDRVLLLDGGSLSPVE